MSRDENGAAHAAHTRDRRRLLLTLGTGALAASQSANAQSWLQQIAQTFKGNTVND